MVRKNKGTHIFSYEGDNNSTLNTPHPASVAIAQYGDSDNRGRHSHTNVNIQVAVTGAPPPIEPPSFVTRPDDDGAEFNAFIDAQIGDADDELNPSFAWMSPAYDFGVKEANPKRKQVPGVRDPFFITNGFSNPYFR